MHRECRTPMERFVPAYTHTSISVHFLQLENYIQDSMKQEMFHMQQSAVQNHTATMIEIGTNLLSQTAEQTRKLTNVEAQVGLASHDITKSNMQNTGVERSRPITRFSCLCVQSYTFNKANQQKYKTHLENG